MIIAIDGVSGSGKSSTAKEIAKKLGLLYIDTGAMYRAITYYFVKTLKGVNVNNDNILQLLKNVEINFKDNGNEIYLNNECVSKKIRSLKVTSLVSKIAAIPKLREWMVEKQRKMATNVDEIIDGVVIDGRDIGSVVFPNANVKIYMTASVESRAKRRLKEYRKRGNKIINLQQCKKSIEERDFQDTHRKTSPLIKCTDAIEIDTSELKFDEQVEKITKIIQKKG